MTLDLCVDQCSNLGYQYAGKFIDKIKIFLCFPFCCNTHEAFTEELANTAMSHWYKLTTMTQVTFNKTN